MICPRHSEEGPRAKFQPWQADPTSPSLQTLCCHLPTANVRRPRDQVDASLLQAVPVGPRPFPSGRVTSSHFLALSTAHSKQMTATTQTEPIPWGQESNGELHDRQDTKHVKEMSSKLRWE